jgi:hypothetical protein
MTQARTILLFLVSWAILLLAADLLWRGVFG